MELNKRYLQSEFPIKNLNEGTIIEVYFKNYTLEWNEDLLVIVTPGAENEGNYIEAVSILNGGFYVTGHAINEYIIKSHPSRITQDEMGN